MAFTRPTARQRNPPKGGSSTSGITALIDCDIITYSIGFACQTTIWEVSIQEGCIASFESKKEMNTWLEVVEAGDEYRITSRVEPEPLANCLHSVKVFMNGVLEATDAQYYKAYLTGKGNFREKVATILPYKGNRKAPKPVHYQAIRDYLVAHWGAEIIEGMEADDALSIAQTKSYDDANESRCSSRCVEDQTLENFQLGCDTIICSIDKDLRNTPGWHYNWNKDEKPQWITEEEATYSFYKQLLTGDRTDNIQGIPGIGPKKAEKILEGVDSELSMYLAVLNAYQESEHTAKTSPPGRAGDVLLENATLLWMVRELDSDNKPVMWEPPE